MQQWLRLIGWSSLVGVMSAAIAIGHMVLVTSPAPEPMAPVDLVAQAWARVPVPVIEVKAEPQAAAPTPQSESEIHPTPGAVQIPGHLESTALAPAEDDGVRVEEFKVKKEIKKDREKPMRQYQRKGKATYAMRRNNSK